MALYTFTFNGGGYNQVNADTKKEAMTEIKDKVGERLFKEVNFKSMRRLTSIESINAYWRNMPIFD